MKHRDYRSPCISCGQSSWRHFLDVESFVIDECEACGLGHTRVSKRDSSHVNEKFYGESYRKFYLDPQTERRLARRFRTLVQKASPFFRGVSRVLDIGCSYGYFCQVAEELGWDVTGLEPNRFTFQELKLRFPETRVFNTSLRKAKLGQQFDLITYWDVLEHIADPDKELEFVYRTLRSGGYLIVHCPNKDSLGAKISGARWGWWSLPDHIFHFTPGSLRLLVERSGFSVIFLETYNTEEEILRGVVNRLSPRWSPRLAAWVDVLHSLCQRMFLPFLYPLRIAEGKLRKGGLIFLLAQRK